MDAGQRREEVKRLIQQAGQPVSASRLARRLSVSRQVIVGDVALLRAMGSDIIATARGYIIPDTGRTGRYIGKLVCNHSAADTKDELYTIVDLGGKVMDVIVEHHLYGELSGQLNLSSHKDVDAFLIQAQQSGVHLLSELTGGVHLHTVSCRDAGTFADIKAVLDGRGFLYSEK